MLWFMKEILQGLNYEDAANYYWEHHDERAATYGSFMRREYHRMVFETFQDAQTTS